MHAGTPTGDEKSITAISDLAERPLLRKGSIFTKALGEEMLERLSAGEALSWICKDDHMPVVRTVSFWKESYPDFAAGFARARREGWDAIADRLRETARGRGDSKGDVQRDRLIIDTDFKLLARWDPQRYGDRTELVHSSDGGPKTPKEMTDAELIEAIQRCDSKAQRA